MKRRLAGLVLLAMLAVGCDEGRAWVEASAIDSATADEALERGDLEQAVRALSRIVEREVPAQVSPEDARVVRQDALERWARVRLEGGDPSGAIELADRALALGEHDDVFTANLLTLRGRAHEAIGRDREAAADYHRALRIEEVLLDRALGGGDE